MGQFSHHVSLDQDGDIVPVEDIQSLVAQATALGHAGIKISTPGQRKALTAVTLTLVEELA